MNLPNKLTVGRICIIPFFVFFLAYDVCGDPNTSRIIAAVALVVVLAMYVAYRWYVSVKETAYEEAEKSIKRAVREAGRPVVKVEVEMKGKW